MPAPTIDDLLAYLRSGVPEVEALKKKYTESVKKIVKEAPEESFDRKYPHSPAAKIASAGH